MKNKLNHFILLPSIILLTAYFIIAALNGQYGVFNRIKFMAEEKLLIEKLASEKARTNALEHRVKRISDDFLDLDLLDQQARKYLAVARSNEIIVLVN